MNAIFFDNEKFFEHIIDEFKFSLDAGDVLPVIEISTFSAYLNVTEKGGELKDWDPVEFPNLPRQLIDLIAPYHHRILVGIPYLRTCCDNCKDCLAQHKKLMHRHVYTKEFLKLNMRFSKEVHMKYYLINGRVYVGGINLTTGKSNDVMVSLDPDRGLEVSRQFQTLWESAETHTSKFMSG